MPRYNQLTTKFVAEEVEWPWLWLWGMVRGGGGWVKKNLVDPEA